MDLKHIIERLKAAKLRDYQGNPLESLEAFMELEIFADIAPDFKNLCEGMVGFLFEGASRLQDSIVENSGSDRLVEVLDGLGSDWAQMRDYIPLLTPKELERGYRNYTLHNPTK